MNWLFVYFDLMFLFLGHKPWGLDRLRIERLSGLWGLLCTIKYNHEVTYRSIKHIIYLRVVGYNIIRKVGYIICGGSVRRGQALFVGLAGINAAATVIKPSQLWVWTETNHSTIAIYFVLFCSDAANYQWLQSMPLF